jgi:hypothetical protein
VGVVGDPNPDVGRVSYIVSQWRGILSTKSKLGGGNPTNGNGKVSGNRGLKCGGSSPLPRSSMVTSSGSKEFNSKGLMFTISILLVSRKVPN